MMPIVHKGRAFSLTIEDGQVVGRLASASSTQLDLRPTGDANHHATYSNTPYGDCTSAWECVDDVSPDGSGSYLQSYFGSISSYSYSQFVLEDTSLATDSDVFEVEAFWRMARNAAKSVPTFRVGSYGETGTAETISSSGWHLLSQVVDHPRNIPWTVADVNRLQFRLAITGAATFASAVTQAWVRVHHADTNPQPVTARIQPGRATHLKLTYADPILNLYVDGDLVDSATYPGPIIESSDVVQIGGDKDGSYFRGGIGSVRIGDTSATTTAYKLDLQMAPAHITPGTDGSSANNWEWTGTIADQSGNGNEATYSITYDPTDVDIVVGPLILAPNQRPGQATTDTPDLVGEVPLAVFLTPGPSPKSSPGRDFFIGPIIESAETSGMPADAWWILVGTLIVGPATALGFKHFRSYVIMSIAGVVGIFVISQIAGLSVWWTAFSALWKAGMIGITQYWRGN